MAVKAVVMWCKLYHNHSLIGTTSDSTMTIYLCYTHPPTRGEPSRDVPVAATDYYVCYRRATRNMLDQGWPTCRPRRIVP